MALPSVCNHSEKAELTNMGYIHMHMHIYVYESYSHENVSRSIKRKIISHVEQRDENCL